MDASRTLGKSNQKGFALVYLALILVAMLGIAALVVDLGYLYISKSQLQNAADAGALAGAGDYKDQLLKQLNDTSYTPDISLARITAKSFADSNKAAGENIVINNGNSNQLSSSNDITVGYWNYSTHTYTPNPTNINAVQVRTRRTADSIGGSINALFGKILGFNQFELKTESIAGFPVRATANIAICNNACGVSIPVGGERIMSVSPTDFVNGFAWTSLLVPQSSAPEVTAFLCKPPPNEAVCNVGDIYSTLGTQASTMDDLISLMYNPLIDSSNKICSTASGDCTSSSDQVTHWIVTIPVTEVCPAGAQGNKADPKSIIKYAKIRIKAICGSGGSGIKGCWGTKGPDTTTCKAYSNNVLVIDMIQCTECGSDIMPGLKPVLLK